MSWLAIEIAEFLKSPLIGDDQLRIENVCTLNDAKENSITFMSKPNETRLKMAESVRSVCILIPREFEGPTNFTHVRVNNPRLSFAKLIKQFFVTKLPHDIMSTAKIDSSAVVGRNVHIGHYAIIGPNVKISDNCYIGNYTQIFSNVKIGPNCYIKSHAMIGQQGFGFEKDENGNYMRIPHIGGVIIENNVELGAFSGIASGTIEPTRVGHHTKIDDHVLVGHNTIIGSNNIIAGGTIISGSVESGQHVWFGPNSSMMQKLKFEDNTTIGVGAVMFNNAKEGYSFSARPALPVNKT